MLAHSPEKAPTDAAIVERRRMARVSVAYPVTLLDSRGRVLARGRTTDISQDGVLAVVVAASGQINAERVILEVTVPKTRPRHTNRQPGRRISYLAKVVRQEPLGQMIGLALEFVEKLARPH